MQSSCMYWKYIFVHDALKYKFTAKMQCQLIENAVPKKVLFNFHLLGYQSLDK